MQQPAALSVLLAFFTLQRRKVPVERDPWGAKVSVAAVGVRSSVVFPKVRTSMTEFVAKSERCLKARGRKLVAGEKRSSSIARDDEDWMDKKTTR
jgi:hypothetical protein